MDLQNRWKSIKEYALNKGDYPEFPVEWTIIEKIVELEEKLNDHRLEDLKCDLRNKEQKEKQ